jgi:large subunit ribosomal protein L6
MPDGIEARQEGTSIAIKGPKGELSRDFGNPKIRIGANGNSVTFTSADERKKTLALLGTFAAHVRNMITGVTSGWETRLKVVYSHFPVKLAAEGSKIIIQNFMGERSPRHAKILGQTKVDIKKDEVIVRGIDKEEVGQTAANIETVTKVTKYDRRVFQDGIYITQKCQPITSPEGSGAGERAARHGDDGENK